jgi:crotonobetainyl-CoA:carnitine CoA-transferase CaiB-like acyl-CoA transferase
MIRGAYSSDMDGEPAASEAADGQLPLSGIRVLDLSTFLAAPVAATLLAEFGADVIKVEAPGIGDFPRWHANSSGGRTGQWAQEGRNKASVTMDLRTVEGQTLAQQLVHRCDVVVTNFRPVTAKSWGLAAEDLVARQPELIVLSVTGYGLTGPNRNLGAFDRIASAFSGHTYVSGYPDRPPVRSGFATVDYLGAYAGAFGVLAALRARDRGQGGQIIDLALTEVALRASEAAPAEYVTTGCVRERVGNRNPRVVPASEARAADGRDVAYHAGNDSLFAKLMMAMNREDLRRDARLATPRSRSAHQDELYGIIAEWIGERDSSEVVRLLKAAGVPVSTVNSAADVLDDLHLSDRHAFEQFDDPELGTLPVVTPVPRLRGTPATTRYLGRALGADTVEVLTTELGLDPAEVARLHERGIV